MDSTSRIFGHITQCTIILKMIVWRRSLYILLHNNCFDICFSPRRGPGISSPSFETLTGKSLSKIVITIRLYLGNIISRSKGS